MSLDRILRREEVQRVCGISRSTMYEMIRAGAFPAPVLLTKRNVGWRESDIAGWLASRPPASGTERR